MDKESGNRTIMLLALLLLAITLFGTTISMLKLGSVQVPLITGLAASDTDFGVVNVTIATNLNVALATTYVDFGNGTLTGAPSFTYVNTSVGPSTLVDTDNPSSFNDPPNSGKTYGLVVRNDGNVDINVTINGTPPGTWMGGTRPGYNFTAVNNETSACGANLTTTITRIDATHRTICDNLTFGDASDEIKIDIFLDLPGDMPAGRTYTDRNVSVRAEQFPAP